jgi:ABC-type multidrug transport system ATPase subunit
VGGKQKRLLSEVDGWVKPGTLTALMGATGAGKTTLLDILSQRSSIGVVSGRILVDGLSRSSGFQRETGYAQQQDVHLPTTIVREALQFSAIMRQPRHISTGKKLAYVDEVIRALEMEHFEDAIVGTPGQGLNVGQRKRLTIGVELAARPGKLLFLDEPTSGLDSETAWMICTLLRKLAGKGQAILCTVHQPSSLLLQMFDQILLIDKGQTVYCGDVGPDCRTITSYLEKKGARPFGLQENAAEWMMEVTNSNRPSSIDWILEWQNSSEKEELRKEIAAMSSRQASPPSSTVVAQQHQEFGLPLAQQIIQLTKRTFIEYWRTPSFLYAKFAFTCGASLAIAFSCWKSPNTLQGLQTQVFALFVYFTILSNLMQQIVAQFSERRSLFEGREGPSKTYSGKAFILSAAITEGTCQLILAVFAFFLFYYPIGMYMDANEQAERGALMFLLFVAFFLFTSTFSHLVTVGIEDRETIANIGSLLFYLILIFCGILVTYVELPRFWKFMYWISPLTYLIGGMFATGVAN